MIGQDRPRPLFWLFAIFGSALVAGHAWLSGGLEFEAADLLMLAAIALAVIAARRLPTSSLAEYSRPSMTSRRITPISAPTSMNSSLADSGTRPPCPKASPASR